MHRGSMHYLQLNVKIPTQGISTVTTAYCESLDEGTWLS